MQVHVNNQAFATYPVVRRILSCTEKMYRLVVALQPEDANAMHVADAEAARLVELKSVRDGALRSQDELAEPPRSAGAKRSLGELAGAAASDAPPQTRARTQE
jgi:hypothetical protein